MRLVRESALSNQPVAHPTATRGKYLKKAAVGYGFLLPAILVLAVIFLYPIIEIVRFSVSTYQMGSWSFVGLQNYRIMLHDPIFLLAFRDNFQLLLTVPVLTVLGVVLAILLYERGRFWRTHRFSVFLPYILAIPVIGIIFGYLFQYNGVINEALRAIGLGRLAIDWLGSPAHSMTTLMLVITWKELGFAVVLFLARLLSVPTELYEAARLDGAGWWQMHLNVSIPQLKSVIRFYVILEMITMISWVFGYVYVMTGGGPANSTMVGELYIYQTAFQFNNPGLASAVGVALLVVSAVFVTIQFLMNRGDSR